MVPKHNPGWNRGLTHGNPAPALYPSKSPPATMDSMNVSKPWPGYLSEGHLASSRPRTASWMVKSHGTVVNIYMRLCMYTSVCIYKYIWCMLGVVLQTPPTICVVSCYALVCAGQCLNTSSVGKTAWIINSCSFNLIFGCWQCIALTL